MGSKAGVTVWDVGPYADAGATLGALVQAKQAAYGDAVGKTADILTVLYPDGIPVGAYGDILLMVRAFDKFSRIATTCGECDPMDENPWLDIAGYGLLGTVSKSNQGPI